MELRTRTLFKDDQMISILTGVVLMLAIGMFVQRIDGVNDLFGGNSDALVLNDDEIVAPPGSLMRIDVFANDTGIKPSHRQGLRIAGEPSCGRTFVKDGIVEYLPVGQCSGDQIIRYSIDGAGDGQTGTILARVQEMSVDDAKTEQAAAAPAEETSPDAKLAAAAKEVAPSDVAVEVDQAPVQSGEDQPTGVDEETPEPVLAFTSENTDEAEPTAKVSMATIEPTAKSDLSGDTEAKSDAALLAALDSSAFESPETLAPATEEAPQQLEAASLAAIDSEQTDGQTEDAARAEDDERDIIIAAIAPTSEAPAQAETPNVETTVSTEPTLSDTPPTVSPAPRAVQSIPSFGIDRPAVAVTKDGAVVGHLSPTGQGEPQSEDEAETRSSSLFGFFSGGSSDAEVAPKTEFMGAVIERRARRPLRPRVPRRARKTGELTVGRTDQTFSGVESSSQAKIALAAPTEQVVDAPQFGGALPVFPLDKSQPEPEKEVDTPKLAARPDTEVEPVQQPAAQPSTVAENCVQEPEVWLDVRRAGFTVIDVEAPCQAGSIARLDYSEMSFGIAINEEGSGQFVALGFEHQSDATLSFADGKVTELQIPFIDIEKISRIALVWDAPVDIELNALEFGADFGTASHVSPENPRGFSDVRRSGGGFLTGKRSIDGVGQNAQIYSHWHRARGQTGAVNLLIDYVSRSRDQLAGTCGDGAHATPQFMVLRTEHGKLQRPEIRRLAAEDCSRITEGSSGNSMITNAVEDLLITKW
jgi:hypothetical protein